MRPRACDEASSRSSASSARRQRQTTASPWALYAEEDVTGSGFWVSPTQVVTNEHVIKHAAGRAGAAPRVGAQAEM